MPVSNPKPLMVVPRLSHWDVLQPEVREILTQYRIPRRKYDKQPQGKGVTLWLIPADPLWDIALAQGPQTNYSTSTVVDRQQTDVWFGCSDG